MLLNLVKVQDEEIKQLKRQLGVAELPESDANNPQARISPLRASSRNRSQRGTSESVSPPRGRMISDLEDQLIAMNQGGLEE